MSVFKRMFKSHKENYVNDSEAAAVANEELIVNVEIVSAKLSGGTVYPEKAWIVLSLIGAKLSDHEEVSIENKTRVREALFLGESCYHKSWVFHEKFVIVKDCKIAIEVKIRRTFFASFF